MALPPLLDELLRAFGPSGFEDEAAAVWRRAAAEHADVSADVLGTSFAALRGTGDGPLVAVVAHLDTIGFQVTHVGADGLVSISRLAGWRAADALGQRVEIRSRGRAVHGVVGRRGEGDAVSWDELFVDVGGAAVEPGDPGVLAALPVELEGGRVLSSALDNRACAWAALEALRLLAADPPRARVAAVGSVQEELPEKVGASAAAWALRPDVALVLDVTYATDVPGKRAEEAGDHRLGGGPAIFRGPAIHPKAFELLAAAAEAEGIPYSVETGMRTMTDAETVAATAEGIPCGLVSVPLRYMHTAGEVVQLSDLEAVARLVAAFVRRLEPSVSFVR